MKVTNLAAWAGADFAYAVNEVIELPDAIAKDRIEAGLCAEVKPVKKAKED